MLLSIYDELVNDGIIPGNSIDLSDINIGATNYLTAFKISLCTIWVVNKTSVWISSSSFCLIISFLFLL